MVTPSYDSVVELLLAHWQGEGPEDRSVRDTCRLVGEKVVRHMPADVAESMPRDARLHVTEIRETLARIVRSDPEVRALVAGLSPTEQTITRQQVSVRGDSNVVLTVGGDLQVSNMQISSQFPPQTIAQPTGEALKKEGTSLTELRQVLVTRFNEDELRTLCFDLGVDYDDLPGEGKVGKARELVAFLDRRSRIPELLKFGRQLRPDVPWPDLFE